MPKIHKPGALWDEFLRFFLKLNTCCC